MSPDPSPYDALLLVSFGGPEGPDDVLPFLENVTRGKNIPPERLAEVGEHYYAFGGRSPINDQNRALLAAIREDFAGARLDLPVYWGNRNWAPYLSEAIAQIRDDGHRRVACFVTSAYSSYSGCRQYRENLAEAAAGVVDPPLLDRLRAYFDHPGFLEPVVDATLAALAELSDSQREGAHLSFVTHSVPDAMNDSSGPRGGAYVDQHRSVMEEVVERVRQETGRRRPHALVYCSRSGPPTIPWLEPDVNDHLERLAKDGVPAAVMVPIGFVSDHMEVVYDLDTEATATAERLSLAVVRAATPGIDPRFVAMARDLLLERAARERGEPVERATTGRAGPSHDVCPARCCPNPRARLATIGGADS